jgi:hypothetical protein
MDSTSYWALLSQQPVSYDRDNIVDLTVVQRPARWDVVPLGQALPAAGPCGVLGHEHWVVPHGGLLAVMGRVGWCQPFLHKLSGVLQDHIDPLLFQVRPFLGPEPEPAAEW